MKAFEKSHLNKISSFLDSISNRMIEDIKTIINGDYGLYDIYSEKDIEYYEFKVFTENYKIDFIPSSANHIQLGFKKTLLEYPCGFMHDMNLHIDINNYNFDNEDELARHNEFYVQVEKRIIEWFNQCWITAGGIETTDNYRISIDHLNTSFDLIRQTWID